MSTLTDTGVTNIPIHFFSLLCTTLKLEPIVSKCAHKHRTHVFGIKNELLTLRLEDFGFVLQRFTKEKKKKKPLLLAVQFRSLTKEIVSGCPMKGTRRTIDNSLIVIL